jgi:hypothetical protein
MLTPMDIDERIARHNKDLGEFAKEAEWMHRDLVALNYPGPNPITGRSYGFHNSCHAYVMLCFAWLDGLSSYWAGSKDKISPCNTKRSQTRRITAFLAKYHSPQHDVHRVAVQLWRHTLMHESKPREICDDAGNHYRWRLYWEMDARRHYTMTKELAAVMATPYDVHVVQMGILPLIQDIRRVLNAYGADLRSPNQTRLNQNYEDRETEMHQEKFPV